MQNLHLKTDSLAAWLQRVVEQIQPEDTGVPLQHVNDALQSVANGDQSTPARHDAETSRTVPMRLIAFYINQAWEACAASDQTAQETALPQLQLIQQLLVRRGGRTSLQAISRQSTASGNGAAAPHPVSVEPADAPKPVIKAEPEKKAEPDLSVDTAIRRVYQLAVQRTPVSEEIAIWRNNLDKGLPFHQFMLLMLEGEEARSRRVDERIGAEKSDGEFVLDLYRHVMGRGCTHRELETVRKRLSTGAVTRLTLLREFFGLADAQERAGTDHALHDGLSCWIMGTTTTLTLQQWQEREKDEAGLAAARAALRTATPFTLTSEPGMRVSAIASLYRGGEFIEQFMENITQQTCFDRHCELIIIDAFSPENEAETIARYLKRHPNIRYERMNYPIGIYEAWNVGVQMARGKYLTNTNLDDLRRQDSLEMQAGVLDNLPFVDVVYQDFYYSFDPKLDWASVAAFGYKSNLPPVTPYNLLRFNSPHNAPMWRKSLHDELGFFDTHYKSAGDYEFWLRCLAARKSFFKLNEPHAVYYQNPKGLSTRADTRGIIEQKSVSRKYAPLLFPKDFFLDFGDYVRDVMGSTADPADFPLQDRYGVIQTRLRDLGRRFKQGQL